MSLTVSTGQNLGLHSTTLLTPGDIWLQNLAYHLNQSFVTQNGGGHVGNQASVVVVLTDLLVCPFFLSFSESGPYVGPSVLRGSSILYSLIFILTRPFEAFILVLF